LKGWVHVEHGEGHEDKQGDHFLHDLELAEIERGVADAPGRYLLSG
jgi:hypothetical protein